MKKQILLTNDDGIRSPGLWAAAAELEKLGFVTVAAPREQSSGMGRSLPLSSDGQIDVRQVQVNGRNWTVHAVGGSPAQAVQHALLEIMPHKPDLVVSGINYGENVATGITISGTVGAAMEAAASGIPALAISLETDKEHHFDYKDTVDFSTAAWFTHFFAEKILRDGLPAGVDLIKVDIPADATPQTPWVLTRLSRSRYYRATPPRRDDWSQPGLAGYEMDIDLSREPEDTDVYALRVKRIVSVTPLTLDMTAHVDLQELQRLMSS